jgi:hypothetical protein
VRSVIRFPFVPIGGFLLAYASYMVIVVIILPVLVRAVGADERPSRKRCR